MAATGVHVDGSEANFESINERALAFEPRRYEGKRVKLSGQIVSITHDNRGTWMTLRVGCFPYWERVIVRHAQSLSHLRDGMVAQVYGSCAGTERVRYESPDMIGLTVSHPLIQAEHVKADAP